MRISALLISVVAHPLLMLSLGLVLLMAINPYEFGFDQWAGGWRLIIICLIYTFVFPLLALFMMRGLGMVKSLQLPTKEERWGPLIVTLVFYFWFFINMKHNPNIPASFTAFTLGSCISLSLGFLFSVFDKISLHALGLGGIVGLILIAIWLGEEQTLLLWGYRVNLLLVIVATLLFSGMVGSARLLLNAHQLSQLAVGFLVGLCGQFLAVRFLY